MTHSGHLLSGGIASVYPILVSVQHLNATAAVCAAGFALLGSLAPDFLELPYPKIKIAKGSLFTPRKRTVVRGRIISHRGMTHSVCLWVFLYLFSFHALTNSQALFSYIPCLSHEQLGTIFSNPYFVACMLGFSFGGMVHLFGDFPNKVGIPVCYPFPWRIRLNIWKSGSHEIETNLALAFLLVPLLYFTYLFPEKNMFHLIWEAMQWSYHYFSRNNS